MKTENGEFFLKKIVIDVKQRLNYSPPPRPYLPWLRNTSDIIVICRKTVSVVISEIKKFGSIGGAKYFGIVQHFYCTVPVPDLKGPPSIRQ